MTSFCSRLHVFYPTADYLHFKYTRRHMDPSTLEMLLLLRYNKKDMWDPFTLDTVKPSFIAERETRKRVREEQLKAREEAVRMRLEQKAKAAAEDSE